MLRETNTRFRFLLFFCAFSILLSSAVQGLSGNAPNGAPHDDGGSPAPPAGITGMMVAQIPFKTFHSVVIIPVSINGSKPVPFALDTGASACVIDLNRAESLKLSLEDYGLTRGEGLGTQEAKFVHDATLSVGGIDFKVQRMAATKFQHLSTKFFGLLGYDFFSRYVVQIDYQNRMLRVFDPAGFEFNGQGEVMPISIKNKLPFITATLKIEGHDPVERNLLVDTGSNDAVNDHLLVKSQPTVRVVGSGAVGEDFVTLLGRFEQFTMGKYRFTGLVGISGGIPLVGSDVWHRFNTIFDYSRSRIILSPNKSFDEPFRMTLPSSAGVPSNWSSSSTARILDR